MTTPDDNERTVSKGLVPSSGRNRALDGPANALPAGTRLAEFELLSVIGEGGFGIVYLAYDHSLSRQVAIKEYMPAELASRTQALTVSVRSERHEETFAAGLRSFINEARLLAQFDHPSLLKVYRFWEAHGTAYMVMPYYAGITLGRALKQRKGPPDEAWLRHLMEHLLNALEQMHEARCYHRDISPDNILIQPDGRPLLLDFGAARRVIGDMQRALTVILKTGYAPVEQYGEMPEMKQGAWTDLYALGSVMHYAIAGQTPPPAVQRFLSDKYVPLTQLAAARYSQGFLHAIDRSLAVQPQDRPQSAAEMRALLEQPSRTIGPGLARPTIAAAPVQSQPRQVTATGTPKPPREPTVGNASAAMTSRREPSFATATISGDNATATIAAPLDVMVPTQAPAVAYPSSSNDGSGRRKFALAGAAVATAVAASAGLVYLLVEFTAPPAQNSATVHYRSNGSDSSTGTAKGTGGAAAAPLAQTESTGQPPSHSVGTQETLGASGTTTTPIDDPAPADTAQSSTATAPMPAQVAATPPPVTNEGAAAEQHAEVAPRTAARTSRSTTTAAATTERRPVSSATRPAQSRRCIDIIQRVSLGEPLTSEEKDILKQECGQ